MASLKIVIPIVALIGVAGLAFGMYIDSDRVKAPAAVISTSPSPSAALPIAGAPKPGGQPSTATGTIEGALVFPAEAIPVDLRVCAKNQDTKEEKCTSEHLKDARFKSQEGYRLVLPVGKYQVYAIADSFDPKYRAFYSAFVTCGYTAGCSDHSPITVNLVGGETKQNIDPGDFYAT